MSFSEAFITASNARTGSESLSADLHPYAYEQVTTILGSGTRKDILQRYCALPPAYAQLAWAHIGAIYDQFQAMPGPIKARHVDLLESSQAGIAVMARYLCVLPDVYTGHRQEFAGMPDTLEGRVAELGEIASRSGGFIARVAEQPMPVAGHLEQIYDLRDYTPAEAFERQTDNADKLVFVQDKDGALSVWPHTDLEAQIKEIAFLETGGVPARSPGCLALHLGGPNGPTVFDTTWGSMVTTAVTDPRFFEQQLQDITATRAEYGL